MANPSFHDCRSFLERQQTLQLEQQKRLARKIHDIVSQKLTLLSLQLSLAGVDQQPPANWAQSCRNWSSLTVDLGHALREVINDLKPRILDDTGLVAALHWYAHTLPENFHCRIVTPPETVRIPTPFANELFSICRDIIGGLFIPATLTEATIEVSVCGATARIHLRPGENGTAALFTPEMLENWSVAERLSYMEGDVQVTVPPAGPPTLTLAVPLPAREPIAEPLEEAFASAREV